MTDSHRGSDPPFLQCTHPILIPALVCITVSVVILLLQSRWVENILQSFFFFLYACNLYTMALIRTVHCPLSSMTCWVPPWSMVHFLFVSPKKRSRSQSQTLRGSKYFQNNVNIKANQSTRAYASAEAPPSPWIQSGLIAKQTRSWDHFVQLWMMTPHLDALDSYFHLDPLTDTSPLNMDISIPWEIGENGKKKSPPHTKFKEIHFCICPFVWIDANNVMGSFLAHVPSFH